MKKYCEYHIKTKQSKERYDCTAHMHESRAFECPYEGKEDAWFDCVDYRLTKRSKK